MEEQKSVINNYFDRQVDDIRSFLDAIPGSYKERDIHQMRVRIKRLKAIFRLLEFMHPVEFRAKDNYRLFKPVFKSAGLIRESQININLLKELQHTERLLNSYKAYVSNLRAEWDINLDRSIESFNYGRLDIVSGNVNDLLSRNTETELIGLSTDFIYSELERIKSLLSESDDLEYLHEVRIILKNIKPILVLLYPLEESVFTRGHYKNLNETETLIGNWHDRIILSDSLYVFFKAREKKKEKLSSDYESLRKKINKNNRSSLGNIGSSLSNTLHAFE